ncbi:MAG: POTRA domain-containing protein [Selenomonas bovis]
MLRICADALYLPRRQTGSVAGYAEDLSTTGGQCRRVKTECRINQRFLNLRDIEQGLEQMKRLPS